MKFLIVFVALIITIAYSKPVDDYLVTVKENSSGGYKVDYNIGVIAKTEERLEDGTVKGGYTYIDTDGNTQKIQYVAGKNGFQVIGNNLPMPPAPIVDTPEVLEAKNLHLALVEDFKSKLPVE